MGSLQQENSESQKSTYSALRIISGRNDDVRALGSSDSSQWKGTAWRDGHPAPVRHRLLTNGGQPAPAWSRWSGGSGRRLDCGPLRIAWTRPTKTCQFERSRSYLTERKENGKKGLGSPKVAAFVPNSLHRDDLASARTQASIWKLVNA
ncbi:hypothetical protein POX_c03813 [Penicillium oxalicum]|uniref:Uncharacterized protein n=1 Tax=Penicillium oxalicum (strain 114-2 / CGMCC 5302) TaxID=933388 RepID=S7Z4I7_PENO1|nr:hypothetical protein POX_c03813 [Penicillium oxalicum]EPS25420.1 hypothetical protein PDE_00353 [Penicillium oxalicum 114-2]KAI2790960.1 hypothetical protein POX_c03813 [Penicillium oxalicum]